MNSGQMSNRRINCMKCEHYYITWDMNFPRGCRIYEFKTREWPSAVVYRSSGIPCMNYKEKKPPSSASD